MKYQQQQQQLLNQSYNNNTPNRLNRSVNPPNNLSLDNSGYGYSPSSVQGSLPSQRLDNLLVGPNNNDPPQPPERGSSYAIMSQVETKVTPPRQPVLSSTPNGVVTTPNANVTPKRVSFQDPTSTPPSPPSPTLEKIIEDPDVMHLFVFKTIIVRLKRIFYYYQIEFYRPSGDNVSVAVQSRCPVH